MKKIIMLLDNCFDPDIRVYKEAKYLVENGKAVEIVCLDKKNKYIDKPEEIIDGILVKRFFVRTEKTTKFIENNRIGKAFKPIVYIHWLLKFMRNVRKYLKTQDYTTIHCHDITMALCATHYIKHKDIVFDMHEYYERYTKSFLNKIMHKLVTYVQNKSKWIIHVNEFQIRNISIKNKNKLIELPNYPETEFFKNVNKTLCDKLRVSYIGVVRDYMSLNRLLECDFKEKIDVKIYGGGSAYNMLLNKAKKINKEFILKGQYNGIEESNIIYSNTDVLYAVYDRENKNWKTAMPIKAFEAIITLTPIIATNGTSLGDFVEKNDIGYTINNNSNDEVFNLINEIYNNRNILNEKIENMKKIQYKYTWNNCVKNLNKIYEKV